MGKCSYEISRQIRYSNLKPNLDHGPMSGDKRKVVSDIQNNFLNILDTRESPPISQADFHRLGLSRTASANPPFPRTFALGSAFTRQSGLLTSEPALRASLR
jgi:hypothetical protein